MPSEDKPYEFAQHVTTQLLTLATGIPALMITFAKDFVAGVSPAARLLAFVSWGFFAASVLFGLSTLMALTGSLVEDVKAARAGTPPGKGIYGRSVTIPSFLQIGFFFLGLCLVLGYGLSAGCDPVPPPAAATEKGK